MAKKSNKKTTATQKKAAKQNKPQTKAKNDNTKDTAVISVTEIDVEKEDADKEVSPDVLEEVLGEVTGGGDDMDISDDDDSDEEAEEWE